MQQALSTPLPEHYLRLRSDNIDEACETITRAYDAHVLTPIGSQHNRQISLYHADLQSLSLSIVDYQSDVSVEVGRLSGTYVLMPVRGHLEVQCAAGHYHCRPGDAVVLNTGTELRKILRHNYKQLVLKFDAAALAAQLRQLGVALAEPLRFQAPLRGGGRAGASWWRALHYVLEELRHSDPAASPPLVTEPLERLLMQNLLRNQPHNHSRALCDPAAQQPTPWYVRRAEQYLQANAGHCLSLASLARCIGVSQRSLQYGFNKSHGVSPMQYLKRLRLRRARQALLAGRPGDSVTPVAMACGFRQLGRFSRQYKECFGESPSQTLRRCGDDGAGIK